ncbi:biotin/lipoyl-binding protein, partial [bacterium]|nr:biotin/lipoyl-binding protein [bacterium]
MATADMEIRLPPLGEDADSGAVASVFVKEGDQIRADDPLLELESEKAVAAIPSPVAGTITRVHVREGDTVKVGQVLFTATEESGSQPGLRRAEPRSD